MKNRIASPRLRFAVSASCHASVPCILVGPLYRRAQFFVPAIAFLAGVAMVTAGPSAQAATFNYSGQTPGTTTAPTTGVFGLGFNGNGTTGYVTPSGTGNLLSFAGTTYTATDDQANLSINALTFTNSGAVTVATSAATNTLTESAATAVTLTNAGALSFAPAIVNGGFLTTFSGAGAGADTFSGIISGTGGVTYSHTGGVLTLSGLNTYGGNTTLSTAATLGIGNLGTVGTTTASAIGTGALIFSQNASIDNTSGAAGTLATNNAVNLSGGSLTFVGTNSLALNGAVTLSGANRTMTITANTLTLNGVVSGAFSLTKGGVGTLALTNANTFTGGVIIGNFSGNVQISNVAALGTGTVQLNATNNVGNTAQSALQLNFAVPTTGVGSSAANPNVITNNITGNEQNLLSSATVNFAHLENVAGFNRLTGSYTITGTGGTSQNVVADAGSSLELAGTLTTNGAAVVGNTRGFDFGGAGNILVSGAYTAGTAPGLLQKDGSGTLTLTGANTYGANTTVNQGTLTVSGNGTLGSGTGGLLVNNNNTGAATATVVNLSTTLDATTGSLSGTIAAASSGTNTATINTGGAGRGFTVNQTAAGNYAGTIAGAGNFALGTGSTSTLTLSGANTYTGTTTVNAGTLLVTGSTAAASAVTVGNSAGTLTGTLGGTGTVGGTVLVNGGSILSAGAGNTPGTLTTGMLTLTTGSTFNAVLLSDTSVSQLTASSTTNLNQAAFSLTLAPGATFALANSGTTDVLTLITSGVTGNFTNATYSTGGYTFTADYTTTPGAFDVDVTAVPEPSTWAAGLLSLGAVGYASRRRFALRFLGLARGGCDRVQA